MAGFLTAGAVGIVVLLAVHVQEAARVRQAAQESVLVAEMAAALQTTADEAAGLVAGHASGEMHHSPVAASEDMGAAQEMDGPSGMASHHDHVSDHQALAEARGRFHAAAGAVRPLLPPERRAETDRVIASYEAFFVSLEDLHRVSDEGGDAMSAYHSSVQVREREAREDLHRLRLEVLEDLDAASEQVSTVERIPRWAVPLLFLVSLLSAGFLLRHQTVRRRLEELRRLSALKDEFLASVSHELRTPLTAIVGLTEMLREGSGEMESGERDELLGLVADESQDLAHLVEDLLVGARLDTGQLELHRETTDLADQVERTLATWSPAQRERIEVRLASLPAVADPLRVRQILRNLLTNALRYGGDHIRIEGGRVAGSRAVVSVVDDGRGVPEGDQDLIFEPYRRSQLEPSRPGSLGLGLAVSRRLAWLMDGDLRYGRADGETRFELILPMEETHQPSEGPAAPQLAGSSVSSL